MRSESNFDQIMLYNNVSSIPELQLEIPSSNEQSTENVVVSDHNVCMNIFTLSIFVNIR